MRRARLLALLLIGVFVSGIGARPAGVASAQTEPGTPGMVFGDGSGRYVEAAPVQLAGALGRALAELEAFPTRPTPDQVKASDFRRRLLELRLLMDFNAFAYEPGPLVIYRDAIDEAYEDVGVYKDVYEVQRLLGEEPSPRLVEQRLLKMTVALAPIRSPEVRETLGPFFAAPSDEIGPRSGKAVPRLWAIAGVAPSDEYDSVGNLARLGHHVLATLRAEGLFVADIFDPAQEERFHDVRKALRSVLLLNDMFPATRDGTADVRAPLAKLVSIYGDVNDRIIAYHAAEELGRGIEERAADVRAAFASAEAQQQAVVDDGTIDLLIGRLREVEASHRR